MEEIDMTMVGGGLADPMDPPGSSIRDGKNANFEQSDLFGHSGYHGHGNSLYGPSVASSIFVSEPMGPGMKAQKSAFNNHSGSK